MYNVYRGNGTRSSDKVCFVENRLEGGRAQKLTIPYVNVRAKGAARKFRSLLPQKAMEEKYFLGAGVGRPRRVYVYEELFAFVRSPEDAVFERSLLQWREIFEDHALPHSALLGVLQAMRGDRPLRRTGVRNFYEAREFILSTVPELAVFWRDAAGVTPVPRRKRPTTTTQMTVYARLAAALALLFLPSIALGAVLRRLRVRSQASKSA